MIKLQYSAALIDALEFRLSKKGIEPQSSDQFYPLLIRYCGQSSEHPNNLHKQFANVPWEYINGVYSDEVRQKQTTFLVGNGSTNIILTKKGWAGTTCEKEQILVRL